MRRLCSWGVSLACFLTSQGLANPAALSGGRHAGSPQEPSRRYWTSLPVTRTGVSFTNVLSPQGAAANQIRINGSGVAAGDVDGDGRCDLYFCGLQTRNTLFRNLGNWRFEDITIAAGLGGPDPFSTGAVFADMDGDQDLDLLVNSIGGGTRLFRNDGAGRFSEETNSGLLRKFGAMSLSLADVDRDGDLDLYVANYRTTTIRSTGFSVLNINGRRVIRAEDQDRLEYLPDGRILEHGEPDQLYLNNGTGRFEAVSWTDGRFLDASGAALSRPPRDWSLSAFFRDINRDGAPDLYVCGDFHSPDRFWMNDGTGRFRPIAPLALRNMPTFSMGVDFADIDRDGFDDFFVADMLDRRREFRIAQSTGAMSVEGDYESLDAMPQVARNTLQRNRGDHTFAEVAYAWGVEATGWTWSAIFLDVDLDGYEDLLLTTGNMFDTQDNDANRRIDAGGPYRPSEIPGKLLKYPPLPLTRLAFRNEAGRRFTEVSAAWGFAGSPGVAHGMCLADLDQDGDLDVIVNRLNDAAELLQNESSAPRLCVRLKGRSPNTKGIGARIEVRGGPVEVQTQEVTAGGRYLSGDDGLRVFAAGKRGTSLRVDIYWPSGRHSNLELAAEEKVIEIEEPDDKPVWSRGSSRTERNGAPHFQDQSERLGHVHFEAAFNDFLRQPALPRRLSRGGPGVGWIDLNNDQREDLVIGSGRGGNAAVFINTGDGQFHSLPTKSAVADQMGVAIGTGVGGATVAFIAQSAFEDDSLSVGAVLSLGKDGVAESTAALPPSSIGPIAIGDSDGDGSLEMFVGGQSVVGRYPEASPSMLFINKNGKWIPDEKANALLGHAGIIQGAIWSDLDGDGGAELAVACEWGPLRIYKHQDGVWQEVTAAWGLDAYRGWWAGIHAADFDGDGRTDLAAGNWGHNTGFRIDDGRGPRLYFGDFTGQGDLDLLPSLYEPELLRWVPEGDLESVAQQIPWLKAVFSTHRKYALASVEEILGDRMNAAKWMEINTLASTVFLNRGSSFAAVPLPDRAQEAPVFGIAPGDFDGDGNTDLFLAQNFFAETPAHGRADAGRGLMLFGDGRGGFRPDDASRSGIAVYGEQRGCATADYDNDGRLDLVVSQNNGATRLFRNVTGRAGLRVRVLGSSLNPLGIGAVIRWLGDEKAGPAHELHAGSGYCSQDSMTVLLPEAQGSGKIEVRWPGGKTSIHSAPADSKDVLIKIPVSTRS